MPCPALPSVGCRCRCPACCRHEGAGEAGAGQAGAAESNQHSSGLKCKGRCLDVLRRVVQWPSAMRMCRRRCLQASVDGGIIWPKPGEAFWERSPRASPMPLQGGAAEAPPVERDGNPMHIIHITAEMAPIAKVGFGGVLSGCVGWGTCAVP